MPGKRVDLYFRCTKCGGLSRITVVPSRYDPGGYYCEDCGELVWVNVSDLRDSKGRRYVSDRPEEDTPDSTGG